MNILNTSICLSIVALGGISLRAAPETMEIQAPHAIKIVEPEVPANYRRWGIPGHVVVDFQINEDGRPKQIQVVKYDDRLYARNVKKALGQWRFEKPAVAGIIYRLPVNFSRRAEGHGPR